MADRVGLGEGTQQVEQPAAPDGIGDRGNGAVIVQVPTGRHVREQQVVLDHRHQGLDVIGVEAHAGGDRLQEVDAHLGVVTPG